MEFLYDGISIGYSICGSGPDLLLLHGWGCTRSVFDAFLPSLSQTHRVIGLDFPGFGESGEPGSVWGVYEYEAMLEAFCDYLGIVEPSIICHSFGGRVAIVFATRRKVGRMIFADAAGIKPRRSLRYWCKVYSFKAAKWFLLKVLRKPEAVERLRKGRGSADYNSSSPMMRAVLSKVVNQDLRELLPSIEAPVLLFWGENDTATPLSDARLMERKLRDAGLVTVPGGSHFSFLDNPALFLAVARNFLG
ncbi:MAG: alpha/beta fold hydrolase [Candidatus Cryptobacteroides sp.]